VISHTLFNNYIDLHPSVHLSLIHSLSIVLPRLPRWPSTRLSKPISKRNSSPFKVLWERSLSHGSTIRIASKLLPVLGKCRHRRSILPDVFVVVRDIIIIAIGDHRLIASNSKLSIRLVDDERRIRRREETGRAGRAGRRPADGHAGV